MELVKSLKSKVAKARLHQQAESFNSIDFSITDYAAILPGKNQNIYCNHEIIDTNNAIEIDKNHPMQPGIMQIEGFNLGVALDERIDWMLMQTLTPLTKQPNKNVLLTLPDQTSHQARSLNQEYLQTRINATLHTEAEVESLVNLSQQLYDKPVIVGGIDCLVEKQALNHGLKNGKVMTIGNADLAPASEAAIFFVLNSEQHQGAKVTFCISNDKAAHSMTQQIQLLCVKKNIAMSQIKKFVYAHSNELQPFTWMYEIRKELWPREGSIEWLNPQRYFGNTGAVSLWLSMACAYHHCIKDEEAVLFSDGKNVLGLIQPQE